VLLRRYHEVLREAATAASREAVERTVADLGRAMRFAFSESAALACRQLADHPSALIAAQDQIFAPFPQTWIEMADDQGPAAFFWTADAGTDGLRRGGLIFIQWHPRMPMPTVIPARLDLDKLPPLTLPDAAARMFEAAQAAPMPWVPHANEARGAVPQMLRWMLAGWALLASHGMTRSIEPDMSRLNRSRARRGLYPLLGFREIRLNLDAERAVHGSAGVATGNMPLHPVRAHLRLLRTGRVVIVSAHMRGNPERGIRGHHYTVTRAEDGIR
jgi:hypothetical protein